jgi:N4-gp56 family major capsid protein
MVLYNDTEKKYYTFTVRGVECPESGTNKIYFNERMADDRDTSITVSDNDYLFSGEGGLDGRDVYATIVLGENAYGTTEITGGGLELIVKQLGSAGTCDPLNQRATVGWKATKVTVRLVEAFMVRIETASTFDDNE